MARPSLTQLIESLKRTPDRAQRPARDAGRRGLSLDQRLPAPHLRISTRTFDRPRAFAGVHTPFRNVDLVIVRENTEDLYSGIEHQVAPGVVESVKVITARASRRIARFAFEYARSNRRKSVTAIHKANIMKLSDGLFLKCARAVARETIRIFDIQEQIVDAACMRLVTDPDLIRCAAAGKSLRRYRVRPVRGAGRRTRAWCRVRTTASAARFSRPCTAPRRISRARIFANPIAAILSARDDAGLPRASALPATRFARRSAECCARARC